MKRCFFCSAPSYGDQTISSKAFRIMRKKEPRLTKDTVVCAACYLRTQHYAEKYIEKVKEKKGSHNSNIIISSQSNESTTTTNSVSTEQMTSTQNTGEVSIDSPRCGVRTRQQQSDSESSNVGVSFGLPRIRRRQKSPDPPANLNQRDAANYYYIKRNSINFGG